MAIWQAHHPDEPRPYTTLPSALEGCRYLVLRLSAGGYQVCNSHQLLSWVAIDLLGCLNHEILFECRH